MSKQTIANPNPAVKAATEKTLSKYGSPQLLSKLRAGTLMGLSKDTALEILQKRNMDISEFTGEAKKPVKVKAEKTGEEGAEKTPKKEKVAKEKVVKEKKEKAPKVAKTPKAPPIDETLPEVDKILNSPLESTKTDKIKALLKLGYSCSQISNCSLAPRYPFVFTVKGKMEAEAKEKK